MLAEAPQRTWDQTSLDGCDNRLDNRRLEQSSLLPVAYLGLGECRSRAELARDGHDQEVRSRLMVGRGTDHHRRTLLDSAVISERETDQNDVAELKAGHTQRRLDCPKYRQKPLRSPS